MKKQRPWPTPELPPAPVSVKTHGPVSGWTDEQWELFHQWATNLKHYPGERPTPTENGTIVPISSDGD